MAQEGLHHRHVWPWQVEEWSRHALAGSVALLSATWARVTILAFWAFGDLLGDAFDGWVVPVLGFLVAPTATVAYALMWAAGSDGVSGAEWIVLGAALAIDVLTWGATERLLREEPPGGYR